MRQNTEARSNLVFAAVSNPTRRKILELLKDGERQAGEVVAAFPALPQPAVSRHLKILREAGLVAMSPQAQRRVYSLQPEKLREVDTWVSTYRVFWSGRLESLEARLDEREGKER
ncbi:MAG: metalloregulator ArsR/SmtB family transcription factor [Thaumarchaeota archaeon]|nr:metalloregulator ArsR/SmtB family transcription factor [Nitrososphaerota archaeon]